MVALPLIDWEAVQEGVMAAGIKYASTPAKVEEMADHLIGLAVQYLYAANGDEDSYVVDRPSIIAGINEMRRSQD